MTRVLIWDLPTRLFHWLLAGGFFAAAFIALIAGEDSALFPYHAILGLAIAGMVVLRVVWGFVGSRHARFGSFAFGPGAVAGYLRGAFVGSAVRHAGHNPGSAYAIFAILALVLAQAATGILLGTGSGGDGVKELHEVIAYATLAIVLLHLAGVALHTILHRENITAGMIHGRKRADASAAIGSPRPLAAIVFLILTGAWVGALASSYDPATQSARLPVVGTSLRLGESEEHEGESDGRYEHREHDEEDDD